MAAARVDGSAQTQMAAISGLPLAKPLLIARDGGPSDGDDRTAAADLKPIACLTKSTDAGAAALEDGEFSAPGSSVIYLGNWAAGDLDGHGVDDDGLPAGPSLANVDQRACTMRVQIRPSEGGTS